MKGRTSRANERVKALQRSNGNDYAVVKPEREVFKPKKLMSVRGKRAQQRLDKPVRGALDAGAYKNGGGIHINPRHKGLLHKDLGVPEGQKIPEAKLEKGLHSENKKVRARARFAKNAEHFEH